MVFTREHIGDIFTFVAVQAAAAGLWSDTIVNLATALRRLAADGLTRGGATGTIRVWDDARASTFEILTPAPVDDLLAGRHPPRRDRDDSRGPTTGAIWSRCDPTRPGPPCASTPGSNVRTAHPGPIRRGSSQAVKEDRPFAAAEREGPQMNWTKQEQDLLVETFRGTDPEAPTLCEGWNVRRLLAHLTQREQSPMARILDLDSPEAARAVAPAHQATTRAATRPGYDALIEQFIRGPRRWSPMSWAADRFNLVEYLIHHEDIRRGRHPTGRAEEPARGRTKRGLATARPAGQARTAHVTGRCAPSDPAGPEPCWEGR